VRYGKGFEVFLNIGERIDIESGGIDVHPSPIFDLKQAGNGTPVQNGSKKRR
jgi:hypothetical protein